MDKILPSYSDPLFSILIITLLVLIVALASLFMGNYKEDRERKSLKKFLGNLDIDEYSLDIKNLPFEQSLIKPLSLVAKTFSTQGEYKKAIEIYLYLIEHIHSFFEKEYFLESLGETYLRAGFLNRAEEIFLEILKKHARNRDVLYHLEVVYELLNDYKKAEETLKPLEIMGRNIKSLENHIKLSSILKDFNISREAKIKKLEEILEEDRNLYRRVIKELFKLDMDIAWRVVDDGKICSILDILWFLPSSNLNFDIISSSKILKSIYIARGILHENEDIPKSGIFAIDTINAVLKCGGESVDLIFSYGCKRCKRHFPISFDRCPKCYAINSIEVKESISRKVPYRGYSLL